MAASGDQHRRLSTPFLRWAAAMRKETMRNDSSWGASAVGVRCGLLSWWARGHSTWFRRWLGRHAYSPVHCRGGVKCKWPVGSANLQLPAPTSAVVCVWLEHMLWLVASLSSVSGHLCCTYTAFEQR